MKLLLDQHYSPRIAEQLRRLGHDVTSVEEQPELRGLPDRDVWSFAISERRAVVTEDVGHFGQIVKESALAAERHFGVVFTSPRSMPRGRRTIGVFVDRLGSFLEAHPADDALADQVAWL